MRDPFGVKNLFAVEKRFYTKNYPALRENYLHKVVAIYKNKLLGVYDTRRDAYTSETFRAHKPGTVCLMTIEEEVDDFIRYSGFAQTSG